MNAQASFDIVVLELTIFATLLGFISIMFIFWHGQVKDKFKNFKPTTRLEKFQIITFHLSFYLFNFFIIFGFGGIYIGIWTLSILAVYTEPLSTIYLEPGVYNQLLFFTQYFSLWVFFTMFYIIFVLLISIWPRVKISEYLLKKRGIDMKENDCFFYREIDGNNKCIIFGKICNELKMNKCDWYQKKTSTYPDGMKSYMPYVNFISQARYIKSQQVYNKLIIIFTTSLAIISIIALLKSFNFF